MGSNRHRFSPLLFYNTKYILSTPFQNIYGSVNSQSKFHQSRKVDFTLGNQWNLVWEKQKNNYKQVALRRKYFYLSITTRPEIQFPRLNSTPCGIYFKKAGLSFTRHPWQIPCNVRFVYAEGEKLKNEHSYFAFDIFIVAHYKEFVNDASRRLWRWLIERQ